MKFLILSACVCMVAAAPQRFTQPFRNAAGVAASPFVAAAQVSSQGATGYVSPVVQSSAYASVPVNAPVVSPVAKSVSLASVKHTNDIVAQILRSNSDVRPDGFNYAIETENGIVQEASGSLKQIGDTAAVVIQGSYRYIDAEGNPIEVTYIADENGYQPQSNVLPVPPPVPEAIARSLEYIRQHPYAEVVQH